MVPCLVYFLVFRWPVDLRYRTVGEWDPKWPLSSYDACTVCPGISGNHERMFSVGKLFPYHSSDGICRDWPKSCLRLIESRTSVYLVSGCVVLCLFECKLVLLISYNKNRFAKSYLRWVCSNEFDFKKESWGGMAVIRRFLVNYCIFHNEIPHFNRKLNYLYNGISQ